MTSPRALSLTEFQAYMRKHGPSRSVVIRGRVARRLVKLASRIDRRPGVCYQISHHHPQGWRDSPQYAAWQKYRVDHDHDQQG